MLVGKKETTRETYMQTEQTYYSYLTGEIGVEGVDWIHLAHDCERQLVLVNMVMKLWVP
jgi:acyl-[acyl carrier protein]--UDP-N-acetylglucosamine O-acyltransferase